MITTLRLRTRPRKPTSETTPARRSEMDIVLTGFLKIVDKG